MEKLFIAIEEPCNSDWDKMLPVNGGKFCSHCSRNVIDFSEFSDSDIIAFVQKQQGNLFCGNFRPTQLDRWLERSEIRNTNLRLYKALMGILMLAASQQISAQSVKNAGADTVLVQKECSSGMETPTTVMRQPQSSVFENAKIRIRGLPSLRQSNDTMLVIDGAPSPFGWLKMLPLKNIKSETFLKGATAAAIYGPAGANGVTIITTSFTGAQRKKFFRKMNQAIQQKDIK